MIFAKVIRHLITQLKQTDVGPFLNKKDKDIQVLFLVKDIAGVDNWSDIIDLKLEVVGFIRADWFLAMLFNELLDALSQVWDDVLPHLHLLFLYLGHTFVWRAVML